MCETLIHRGPDDGGVFADAGMGIGMRRLSVIDLRSGHQPIHNEDASLWIVFNGEIYNYRGLRADLEAAGHRFYTSSDTETILHLYEEHGAAAAGRLNGMFAFAIVDTRRRRLVIARDPCGIKPLYYYWDGRDFVFGSEIKSLLVHPRVGRAMDLSGVNEFFAFGYVPGARTLFRGIRKLLPGYYLTLDDRGVRVERYRTPGPVDTGPLPDGQCVGEFLAVFRKAVERHLVSDVPLGAFLSGGVDSGLVVAVASEVLPRPIETFSIGFDETGAVYDERRYARVVAERFGTVHREFVIGPESVEALPTIVRQFDEPLTDASAVPNYHLSREARRHVTVALSGLGGDELCAGYERYLGAVIGNVYEKVPAPIRRAVAAGVARLPDSGSGRLFAQRVKRFATFGGLPLDARYLHFVIKAGDEERRALFTEEVTRAVEVSDASRGYREYWAGTAGLGSLERMLRVDMQTYLVDDLLALTDRVSMAHSLEVRVPFLDREVVDFFSRVPAEMKLRRGKKKYLLKRAAETLLPRSVIYRPKKGFSLPLAVWFRGPLKAYTEAVLDERKLAGGGLLRPPYVRRLLDEHCSGRANHEEKIFALLSFVTWQRIYFP